MIEEIELGGIKVPLRDLEITPESIKQVLKILLEERNKTKNRRARACHQSAIPNSECSQRYKRLDVFTGKGFAMKIAN